MCPKQFGPVQSDFGPIEGQAKRPFTIVILEAQSMKKSKVKHKIHTYYVVKKKQNLLRDAKVICF